jgi:hypothetical protein
MSLHRRVCLFVVSYLPLASCIGSFCDATYAYAESNGEISATHSPKAVLFVGNSFTFSAGGIDNLVEKLAESAKPAIAVKADKIWKGGATLKVLYEMPRVLEKIETGEYDVVVVQGDIPEAKERTVKSFENHAKLFAAKIKRKGNTPVLFMAWPYKRLGWVSLKEISNSHRDLSNELGIKVAPVGLAFQMATKERPDLRMLGKDEEHQSIHGAFLAASVLYATVFTKNPAECTYHPRMVTPDEAAFLKRVAWNTVQEWNRGNRTKNSTEAAEVVID